MLFTPLLLPYTAPESWGKIHSRHPHETYSSYTTLFRTISTISFLLHVKSTGLALVYNTPESRYYRHRLVTSEPLLSRSECVPSRDTLKYPNFAITDPEFDYSLLHPFKEEHRSSFDRSTTAIGKVFSAISEHPAISAVGWDVILSGVSIGVWAAIRGLDGNEMYANFLVISFPNLDVSRVLTHWDSLFEQTLTPKSSSLGTSIPFMKRTEKETEGAVPVTDIKKEKTVSGPTRRSTRGKKAAAEG